jgi:hypothetical protein
VILGEYQGDFVFTKQRQDVLKKQNNYPPPLFAEENVYLVTGPPETHFCLCFTKVKTFKHHSIEYGL